MGHFDTFRPPPVPTFGPWSVDTRDARGAQLERGAVTQSAVHSQTGERALLAWVHWSSDVGPREREALGALRSEILSLPQVSSLHAHPRLARITDTGFAEGPYFAMRCGPGLPLREVYKGAARDRGRVEYELRPWAQDDDAFYRGADGQTLVGPDHRAILVHEAPIERRFALRLVADAAGALETLHAAAISHGGVTLDRLFLADAGTLSVTHFGVERGERGRRLTAAEATPLSAHGVSYAAPEELLDPQRVGPRADVFALGVILHELLTFTHLFRARSQSQLVEQVLSTQVVAPSTLAPGLPALVDDIVLQALAHDPALRFGHGGAMQHALEVALADEPPCGPDDLATLVARAHRAPSGKGARIAFW